MFPLVAQNLTDESNYDTSQILCAERAFAVYRNVHVL